MDRRLFYDKRIAMEVPADSLGDEYAGYVFRIMGGNDKQGFPMKQGVMLDHRIKLLMLKGHSCYRPRRRGERKRKSVRCVWWIPAFLERLTSGCHSSERVCSIMRADRQEWVRQLLGTSRLRNAFTPARQLISSAS